MSDVIPIKLKEPSKRIWECGCGGQQWFVHENGGIECCTCNEINQTIKCEVKE
jgi:hypothetical protein